MAGSNSNEKFECMMHDHVDGHPHARVIYNNLPRQSKNKLFEVLHNWSQWHAHHFHESNREGSSLVVESGHEIHFPALKVINTATARNDQKYTYCNFVMDGKPVPKSECYRASDPIQKYDNVPRYDRAYALPLGSAHYSKDGGNYDWKQLLQESSRCFNCDSYSHSLKECPQYVDNRKVAIARNDYNKLKRKRPGAPSIPHGRYFEDHHDKTSGLKMYPCDNQDDNDEEMEEGDMVLLEMPEKKKRKTVRYCPGINADPIPEKADNRLWMPASHNRPHHPTANLDRPSHHSKHNSNQRHKVRDSRHSSSRYKNTTRRRK